MLCPILLFFFFFTLLFTSPISCQKNISFFSSNDSPWTPQQNKTLLSPTTAFAAGFYPVPTSPNRFTFSVWFYNISLHTPVWSTDMVNSNSSLIITDSNQLKLLNSAGDNIWPENATGSSNTSLVLTDDGNLLFGNWESFHFPKDTILTGQNITLTNLTSNNGKFSFVNEVNLVFNNSNDSYWSASNKFIVLESDGVIKTEKSGSVLALDFGESQMRRLTLDDDGNLKIYSYDSKKKKWSVSWQAVQELCLIHGTCGANAICMNDDSSTTYCVCPPGFRKTSDSESYSCERKIPLSGVSQDSKFLALDYVNYSGSSNSTDMQVRNFSMCQSNCLKNRNCLGFGFKYDGKGYCVLQLDQMLNGYWSPGTETVMYLRVSKKETDKSNFTGMTSLLETTCPVRISLPLPPEESDSTRRNIVIISVLFAAELISGVLFFWAFLKKYIKYRDMARNMGLELLPAGGPKRFGYAELKAATNDFSNSIGRGAFGDVYKGELSDRRVVAVKCLKDIQGSAVESEEWYFPRWAYDIAYKEMKIEDILDRCIKHSYDSKLHCDMLDRMVKTAMWCLQDRPENRPSMGKVAKMLEGTVEITEPQRPTIFFLGDE
ncbi:hypothetical protein ACFE04_029988 [Oxalis oulophora]